MHCEVYLRRNISCLQCKIAKSRSWHKTYMHNALMRYGKELKNGKHLKKIYMTRVSGVWFVARDDRVFYCVRF